MKRIPLSAVMTGTLVMMTVPFAGHGMELMIEAGDVDRVKTPVQVMIALPKEQAGAKLALLRSGQGPEILGQLTAPGLLAEPVETAEDRVARELHFILPKLEAGKSTAYSVTFDVKGSSIPPLKWYDEPGNYNTLMAGKRPVMVYMYSPLDESTAAAREATYKVFHHVYDPEGKQVLTKGPGGRYTHHRGIFYGFNRTTYGDNKRVDIWHCTGDTHQSHEGFLAVEEGPVLARHLLAIDWHGVGKEVFAKEQRELTVYNFPGERVIDFSSRLKSTGTKIRLDGDPQHAGFHFRASNEVAAKTSKQTYYLRPDGKGKMGETRNWPGRKDHVNLPWDAMIFVVGGQRYTCCYLDHPQNPKEARYSERDYGRFGSYFEYDLEPSGKLDVKYRLWLAEGEMTVDRAAAIRTDFADPPKVTLK